MCQSNQRIADGEFMEFTNHYGLKRVTL